MHEGETYQQRSANPRHPNYWRLWFEEAGIYLSMRANEVQSDAKRDAWVRLAGEAWIKADEVGAPPGYGLRAAGESLTRRGLDRRALLGRELEIWQQRLNSSPEEVREEIEQQVRALASLCMAIDLDRNPTLARLAGELQRRGQGIPDIRALQLPFKPEAVEPPSGGTFRIVDGHVVCAEAEAFVLERSLSQSLKRLRELEPDSEPTLSDIGWLVPPLRVPLTHNAVFRLLEWYPCVPPPEDPTQLKADAKAKEPPAWWEVLPPLPSPESAFGLKPARHLRYWIEGDRVRVAVHDPLGS